MPSLRYTLRRADFGLLKIIASAWGIEGNFADARSAAETLAGEMPRRSRLERVISSLTPEAREALGALRQNGGKIPWQEFLRRFGEFREMGAGRREREKPHLNPISPAEMLWYGGLIGRAFLPTARGPVEFAYIPDELLALMTPAERPSKAEPLGRAALPHEHAFPQPADARILDHITTFLAAVRGGMPAQQAPDSARWRCTHEQMHALARSAGLLTPEDEVDSEAARRFLEASPGNALLMLWEGWLSGAFNDLRLMPGLTPEGTWQNDPRQAHSAVLGWVAALPPREWWSISAFIAAVRDRYPDFQRPLPGDYDSWYFRDAEGNLIHGWEAWEQVDGALLRFVLTGPMHWLGALDLASPKEGAPPTAFRLSEWGIALLKGEAPNLPLENAPLIVRSDGQIIAPPRSPRSARYQIARFADWEGFGRGGYRFRLSAAAMRRAQAQGLKPAHVLTLLRQYARVVPPSITRAVANWEERGAEATLAETVVLYVRDPKILQKLRSGKAQRFLGKVLSPVTVEVRRGAEEKVLAALTELGYFGELLKGGNCSATKDAEKKF